MPRVLVTGASGFIGRAVSSALLDAGCDVATLQRSAPARAPARMTAFSADLLALAALSDTLERIPPVSAIVHLAALLPNPRCNAADYLVANGAATAAVLEWGCRGGSEVFVYASSTSVLGVPAEFPITEAHPTRPVHPYAVGKLSGEISCEYAGRTSAMRTVSLRIGSPYGPGMPEVSVLPRFVRQALRGDPLAYHGTGAREQVFVHVRDVVSAIRSALDGRAGGIFNVTGAEPISMKRLAETIVRLSGGAPATVSAAGVPDPQEEMRWPVSLDRSARDLGYRPGISLEEGLTEYLQHCRNADAEARRATR
jgi:UDP-glucose 4-epimerase